MLFFTDNMIGIIELAKVFSPCISNTLNGYIIRRTTIIIQVFMKRATMSVETILSAYTRAHTHKHEYTNYTKLNAQLKRTTTN